jgi:hypothetical protein
MMKSHSPKHPLKMRRLWMVLLGGLLGAAPSLRADVWDLGGDNDNDMGTDNEITHGMDQVHDLAAQQAGSLADADWYRLEIPGRTSWEIIVDGMTGDVSDGTPAAPALDLLASDGTTGAGPSAALSSFGVARHLTTLSSLSADLTRFVRVSGAACGLSCTADDQYRIRAYETTLYLPRYNNGNGQVTVLVLQNNRNEVVAANAIAYGAGGTSPGVALFTLQPYEVAAYNLATFQGGLLNATSGGLRIYHTAAYGQLTGKAVAVEPATGFTFDTAVLPRPH